MKLTKKNGYYVITHTPEETEEIIDAAIAYGDEETKTKALWFKAISENQLDDLAKKLRLRD